MPAKILVLTALALIGAVSLLAAHSRVAVCGATCANICARSADPAECLRHCCDGASGTPGCRK